MLMTWLIIILMKEKNSRNVWILYRAYKKEKYNLVMEDGSYATKQDIAKIKTNYKNILKTQIFGKVF